MLRFLPASCLASDPNLSFGIGSGVKPNPDDILGQQGEGLSSKFKS
jgi:hypothetical protein